MDVVRRFGGAARWRDIVGPASRHALRAAVGRGELLRPQPGIYALPTASASVQAIRITGGLLSHQSAAAYWLLEGVAANPQIHVTVPRHARPAVVRDIVLHYVDVPAGDDHGEVTSPIRTVLDCAGVLPFGEALSIADSALRRELITAEELVAAALVRGGPGHLRRVRVAAAATGAAANPLESRLRAVLIEARIAGFRPQCEVVIGGRSRYVDLGDERRRIALEADSFTFHGSREALERDCRRYNELIAHDWLVLRFAWEHVMFDAQWVVRMVQEARALRPRPRG